MGRRALPRALQPFARSAYYALYRGWVRFQCWWADRLDPPGTGPMPLPPARLRFRVGESVKASVFLRVGEQTAANIEAVLEQSGASLRDCRSVLDFGCGCGRTLMFLARRNPAIAWHGTDVDAEAVGWCRAHLAGVRVSRNGPLPPLEYPEAAFDLVYGVSVFTHLEDEYQRAWIPEFRRILKPGGLLLLSSYGEHVWKDLDPAGEVRSKGWAFLTSSKLRGIHPDWYQTAFQTPQHMAGNLAGHFRDIRHVPRGFGDQDAMLARRD